MKSESKNSDLNDKKNPDKSIRLSNLDLEPPVHWEIAKNMFSLSKIIFLDALGHLITSTISSILSNI